ncbi:MAG: PAS domain S-box protein [Candidatus Bathyarchaeia archaeon]|jgi:PAS domain S-box-containing protein
MNQRTVESGPEVVVDLSEKKPIRVLHVDDEVGLLKISKQCLEMQESFQVHTASSVDEAMEKMKKQSFDVLVSDYQMPGKNGLQFLQELRQKGDSTPFIIFTGRGREEIAVKALNLGASQYLSKNGNPETVYCELAHDIQQAAKRSRDAIELKKAERRLFDEHARLLNIFSASPSAIIVIDLNGKITECNEQAQKLFGYLSKDEIIGKNVFSFIAEKDRERATENVDRTLKQGILRNIRYFILNRDGHEWLALVSASVIQEPSGNPSGFVIVAEDITERKQVEQELHRFSVAIKTSLDGVISGDLNGNIADVNEAALRMYGGTDKSDLIGKNVIDLLVERDRTRALHDSMESMRTGRGKTVEYCALTKSGIEIPIEITTAFMKEEQGEPTGFVDIIRNTAERKKAELALKESEARYRSLVEQSLAGIIIAQGPAVHAVFVNRAMTDIWGYTVEEFCSLPQQQIEKMIHPEDRSLFFKSFEQRLEGKNVPSHYEFRALRKDGNVIWLEISAGLIEYNGRPAVQGIFTDITERKKMEESLRENKEKFEGLFTGNPEATVYLNPDFHILDLNPRFAELFGYSLEEVKDRHIDNVLVPKNMMEEAEMLDKKAIDGYVYHDTVRARKDGSLVAVSISAAPILIQGLLAGYIGVYKDISELKKTEQQLAMMNEKLRVVGGLTRHDVRNKLSTITGNAYMLKKQLADNKEVLDEIRDMEKAVSQVTRIFDFAKDYEMLGVEELTYIDVQKSVNEAAQLFSDLDGVRILNECHGLTVLSDSLLQQLFYNLIDNSLKHGEKLSQIRIHYEKAEGNQLRLVYEDDGVGISQEAKPKLFSEGYTAGKGSGYGLYLVKRMMEVYGWTIQETSIPGIGVRFTIVMPEKNQNGKETYQLH